MARIGIDATAIESEGKGLARYQTNIVRGLSRLGLDHDFFVFSKSADTARLLGIDLPRFHFIQASFRASFFWDQFQMPRLVKHYGLDLIHTAYDRLPLFYDVPSVMYLFETPFFRTTIRREFNLSETWYERTASFYTTAIFPHSIKKADRIVTSSEFTKRELEEEFAESPSFGDKVKVAYPAQEDYFHPPADSAVHSEIKRQISGGEDYLLHFSTGDPRDNTAVVLQAFQMARKQLPPNLKLLIVGARSKRNEGKNTHSVANSASDHLIIYRPFATGEALVRLYQGATAYVDPSLYEGFGFQFLEAMACGTPVIGSNVTAVPEVVGGAGILVDPRRADQLAAAMVQVVTDHALRDDLIQKGLRRAALFSWDKTSQKIAGHFEEVLQSLKQPQSAACLTK